MIVFFSKIGKQIATHEFHMQPIDSRNEGSSNFFLSKRCHNYLFVTLTHGFVLILWAVDACFNSNFCHNYGMWSSIGNFTSGLNQLDAVGAKHSIIDHWRDNNNKIEHLKVNSSIASNAVH